MATHVIVGAGPVGSATANLLAERGDHVRVVTRRGTGPQHANIELVAADASDAAALRRLASGAAALYNCANPPYHRWPTDWPPIASALLSAAESSGAVLVTANNVYGYGPVDVPMTEDLPFDPPTVKGRVRAKMWHDALAAHTAGRIRATEARASDYLGPGAASMFTLMVLPRVLAGKRAMVPADLDAPHSWSYPGDVARTLVALAGDERAWGRPWHVPTDRPVSIRDLATRAAALAGAPTPKALVGADSDKLHRPRLSRMPMAVLRLGGLFNPTARELPELAYEFDRPFILDSTRTTATFGIEPTPLDQVLRSTVAAAQASSSGLAASGSPSKSTME
jgi:nucleoside-diphosphate-sugar epimerase